MTRSSRWWLGTLLALLLAAPPAGSQTVIGEADVIRLARARSPERKVAGALSVLAAERERTAGLLRNPSVEWQREALMTNPASSEDVIRLTVPVDFVRPRATRALVASESAWLNSEASLTRSQAVLDTVLAYYDVALAIQRTEILRQAAATLEEAARVLARREAAGSASGYESLRLAVASQLGQSQLAEAQGHSESARTRLALLLQLDPKTLRINASLSFWHGLKSGGPAQREVRREATRYARIAQQRAAEAQEDAELGWLPSLEFGGGVKRVQDAASDYGYVAGVAVNLPIFDHGQALKAQAQAQRMLAMARSEALNRRLQIELSSAAAFYWAARRELDRFESETAGPVEALLVAAKSGYDEGELSIVELLDAQRARTEVAERRLSLLGKAKRTEARLRSAAGKLE